MSLPVFEGPVVSVVQDARDSTTFIHTKSGWGLIDWGYLGHIGFLTDTSVYLGGERLTISFQPATFINDSLTSAFATFDQTSFYGYVNLDRVRARKSPGGISISQGFPSNSQRPTYAFSTTGDTLRSFGRYVDYGRCSTDTTIDSASGVTGFVQQTPFYIVGMNRYDKNDCASHTLLPHPVVSISPYRDRVLFLSADNYILSEATDYSRQYATVSRSYTQSLTWSDLGNTVRFVKDQTKIVSLHSDGTVDSITMPVGMRSSRTTLFWSHDGTIATMVAHDSLVSFDVRTGSILREYIHAPWLPYVYPAIYTTCRIGNVDGRIVVSLPNGCVATFPGITLPITSSVNTSPSPFRPLQVHGACIEGATPQCAVTIYSVLGAIVMQGNADHNGTFDLTDKRLPHGAYVVVYFTAAGARSSRVLL